MRLFICILMYTHLAFAQWIDYPDEGTATLTHYDLPKDYIAACGCTGDSTHYPTAALSQMAYGSSAAFGPACGYCFNLTLLNSYTSTPPFFPTVTKSVVVKITDRCPLSEGGWCSGTEDKPNSSGQYLNFDLAYPSSYIKDGWFPSNVSYYGYTDFGVWNITYKVVSCTHWAGWNNAAALGSVAYLDSSSVCCPANPTGNSNDTCPSYSDHNGLAPDTTTDDAFSSNIPTLTTFVLAFVTFILFN
ncbi:hypothetical protein CYLTODRAFT_416289 [Cylindrobasidium torrendii FP15055 ss-10]|uniref:Expansin-like EG45 domain-containing protein n=1 Tax=Cylindrobasidium torrendii FP15055 ss-10 TaxID=1314674 RepID=A0A0D7BVJ7_9AGAR|nr:hypothetical protein CYLTODRAFT_416289 [Cylindrobasidium torrendii FP15055 ss-10]